MCQDPFLRTQTTAIDDTDNTREHDEVHIPRMVNRQFVSTPTALPTLTSLMDEGGDDKVGV